MIVGTEYEKLTDKDRDRFSEILNKILTTTFVLEKKYSVSDNKPIINRDFRFIEYNKELFRDFLSMMGWTLKEDRTHGLYHITSKTINNHRRLDKNTTIFLLILRILYDKKLEEISKTSDAYFRLGDVLHEGEVLGVINSIPSQRSIIDTMRLLRKYNIIEKISGNYTDPNSSYILYPTITHMINSSVIEDMVEEFNKAVEEYEYAGIIKEIEIEGEEN